MLTSSEFVALAFPFALELRRSGSSALSALSCSPSTISSASASSSLESPPSASCLSYSARSRILLVTFPGGIRAPAVGAGVEDVAGDGALPFSSNRMCVCRGRVLLLLLLLLSDWASPGVRCSWSLTWAMACLMKRFAAALSTAVFPVTPRVRV